MFFLDSIDSSVLIAAGASFVAGVFGYIIARFWVKPILGYSIAKHKLDAQLTLYLDRLPDAKETCGNDGADPSIGEDALRLARRLSMDLVTSYNEKVPYWYRLFLDSRQESPVKASGLLTNINKIKDVQQRRAKIDAARKELKQNGKKKA